MTAFTLHSSAEDAPTDAQQWSGSDPARTRTMPEMEKGRPPENKRSRKPAHPVKREINQEMKVRLSVFEKLLKSFGCSENCRARTTCRSEPSAHKSVLGIKQTVLIFIDWLRSVIAIIHGKFLFGKINDRGSLRSPSLKIN